MNGSESVGPLGCPPPRAALRVTGWARLTDALVSPSPLIADAEERHRAVVLAGMLVFLTPLAVVFGAASVAARTERMGTLEYMAAALIFTGAMGIYGLSRSRYSHLGTRLFVALGLVAPWATALLEQEPQRIVGSLFFTLVGLLYASFLLPHREVLISALALNGLLTLLAVWHPVETLAEIVHPLFLICIMSFLVVVGTTLRKRDMVRVVEESERANAALRRVRVLSERIVGIQEEERQRLARDVHDGLGQMLAATKLTLDTAAHEAPPNKQRVEKARDLCTQAIADLRHLVRNMHPMELSTGSVGEALRAQCDRFRERSEFTVIVDVPRNLRCPNEVALCLLRILQEALTNVLKHSTADTVWVALTPTDDNTLVLDVRDNGKGGVTLATQGGTGLRNMRERCEFQGGSLQLDSHPSGGTHLVATISSRVETS